MAGSEGEGTIWVDVTETDQQLARSLGVTFSGCPIEHAPYTYRRSYVGECCAWHGEIACLIAKVRAAGWRAGAEAMREEAMRAAMDEQHRAFTRFPTLTNAAGGRNCGSCEDALPSHGRDCPVQAAANIHAAIRGLPLPTPEGEDGGA